MCIFRITWVLLPITNIKHPFQEKCRCYVQSLTQISCIQLRYFVRNNSYIICWLIKNQQFTVSVVDSSSRWILSLFKKRIAICIFLVIISHYLQNKKSQNIG